jgi:hypothetical protein
MHQLKDLIPPPASPAPVCRLRTRSWFRDPALWAWAVVGLLALLPLGSVLAQLAT